jgi:hypothetical protein
MLDAIAEVADAILARASCAGMPCVKNVSIDLETARRHENNIMGRPGGKERLGRITKRAIKTCDAALTSVGAQLALIRQLGLARQVRK